jgi:hypothetical protein
MTCGDRLVSPPSEISHRMQRDRRTFRSRSKSFGRRVVFSILDVQSRTRLRARAWRHLVALIVSTMMVAAACLLVGPLFPERFAPMAGDVDPGRPRTWPLQWLSAPLWLCMPYALASEWLGNRRHIRWWIAPGALVIATSLLWSTLIGEAGSYEGYLSLIKGIPIGIGVSLVFLTYWIPLLLVRRFRRSQWSGRKPRD